MGGVGSNSFRRSDLAHGVSDQTTLLRQQVRQPLGLTAIE